MPDEDFDPRGYSLEDMTEEQKDQLIVQLANSHDTLLVMAVSQHNAMLTIAQYLVDHNVLGMRKHAILEVAWRLSTVAEICRTHLGIDAEQQKTNDTFEDIVAGLDLKGLDDDE